MNATKGAAEGKNHQEQQDKVLAREQDQKDMFFWLHQFSFNYRTT